MAKALTELTIAKMKPRASRYEIHDARTPGLYLVVQPSGAKSWAYRYRSPVTLKPAKLTIGSLSAFGLADARRRATDAARAVAEMRDPAREKKAARAKAADQSDLVEVQLDEFIAKYVRARNRPRTAAETERIIRLHIRPVWEGRKVGSITPDDVHDLLARIEAPIAANRTLSVVRKFFNWMAGRPRPLVRTSPAAGIKPPTEERSRDRILSDDEIRALWQATDSTAPLAVMVRLLILTGQRRNEVAGMRWSEIESLDGPEPIWIIPAARAKNGKPHAVPLAPQVVEILSAAPRIKGCDYVLSTTGTNPVSGFSRYKVALDRKLKISEWRLHDLRRTVASGLAALGEPVEVAEKVLNHTSGTFSGIVAVYQKHDFAREKRRALEKWARHVETLITGQPADNVL